MVSFYCALISASKVSTSFAAGMGRARHAGAAPERHQFRLATLGRFRTNSEVNAF
jgi:hypothetical protein